MAAFSWQSIECPMLLNTHFVGVLEENEILTRFQHFTPAGCLPVTVFRRFRFQLQAFIRQYWRDIFTPLRIRTMLADEELLLELNPMREHVHFHRQKTLDTRRPLDLYIGIAREAV